MTAALRLVLNDRPAAARLGAAARERVLERYSIERTASVWLAAYQELSTAR
jgi:glycosyltransferase involved in cell wall biosynthesis